MELLESAADHVAFRNMSSWRMVCKNHRAAARSRLTTRSLPFFPRDGAWHRMGAHVPPSESVFRPSCC